MPIAFVRRANFPTPRSLTIPTHDDFGVRMLLFVLCKRADNPEHRLRLHFAIGKNRAMMRGITNAVPVYDSKIHKCVADSYLFW